MGPAPGRRRRADALDAALRDGIVERAGDEVRFAHSLLAAAIDQAATRDERRGAHELLLDRQRPDRSSRHLAPATESPDAAVAGALEEAVTLARARGWSIAAAELADRALRVTPPDAFNDRVRRAITAAHAHEERATRHGLRRLPTGSSEMPAGACRAPGRFPARRTVSWPSRGMDLLEALRAAWTMRRCGPRCTRCLARAAGSWTPGWRNNTHGPPSRSLMRWTLTAQGRGDGRASVVRLDRGTGDGLALARRRCARPGDRQHETDQGRHGLPRERALLDWRDR